MYFGYEMCLLHKEISGELHYWLARMKDDKTVVLNWGKVGSIEGQEKWSIADVPDYLDKIKRKAEEKEAEGYEDIMSHDYQVEAFIIVYEIPYDEDISNGKGKELNLFEGKMKKLYDQLFNKFVWSGVGNVLEPCVLPWRDCLVYCAVVDNEIANEVFDNEFKNTEFSDYKEIILNDYFK